MSSHLPSHLPSHLSSHLPSHLPSHVVLHVLVGVHARELRVAVRSVQAACGLLLLGGGSLLLLLARVAQRRVVVVSHSGWGLAHVLASHVLLRGHLLLLLPGLLRGGLGLVGHLGLLRRRRRGRGRRSVRSPGSKGGAKVGARTELAELDRRRGHSGGLGLGLDLSLGRDGHLGLLLGLRHPGGSCGDGSSCLCLWLRRDPLHGGGALLLLLL